MSFLKKMEEKREKEKEEMEETRRKERQEDRNEMVKLMDRCIDKKVGEMIEPYKERTEKLEKGQVEMKEQVDMLLGKVNQILTRRTETSTTVTEVPQRQYSTPSVTQLSQANSSRESVEDKRRELISLSRRTVGLQRIDNQDIQRMFQEQYGGAKSEEEARLLAVKEYLRLELKLSEGTIEQMEIERIFTPARENPEWLYVTYMHEGSVAKIFEKTRLMRKESRIMTYIPREYHDRFEAIRNIGNQLRLEGECKTRIKMGYRDLQLHKKDRVVGKWELVMLPDNLPPVRLDISPEKAQPGSPAPGRPEQSRREKRGRESTGSTGQSEAKSARTGEEEKQDEKPSGESELKENKELELSKDDTEEVPLDNTGKVIHEESYCPASPAPAKQGQTYPYSSPIFQKSKTKLAIF